MPEDLNAKEAHLEERLKKITELETEIKKREKAIKENYGNYIMIVEGAIPLGSPGYCTIAGRDAREVFEEGAAGAEAIIAWGNCASSGCIQHAHPNPTDAQPVHKVFSGKPVINVQGCLLYTSPSPRDRG